MEGCERIGPRDGKSHAGHLGGDRRPAARDCTSDAIGHGLSSYPHLRRLRHAVGSAVVGVDSHQQGAAVGVSEPCGDGWDVDAGFDREGGKRVSQIMVGQPFDAVGFAGPREGLRGFAHREHPFVRRRPFGRGVGGGVDLLLVSLESFEQRPGGRDKGNFAVRRFGLASAHTQYAPVEIDVRPNDASGLTEPASGVGEKAAKIRGIAGHTATAALDFVEDFGKFCGFRQIRFARCAFQLDPAKAQGVATELALFDGDIEESAEGVDALVDERRG